MNELYPGETSDKKIIIAYKRFVKLVRTHWLIINRGIFIDTTYNNACLIMYNIDFDSMLFNLTHLTISQIDSAYTRQEHWRNIFTTI
jgi:hypothetical protein